MIRTRIIGTGSYVPPDILTNDNLSEMVDTSDEWIKTRTGICNRHIAKDMDNADMAYNAARNAVEDAHIEASNIGLIIVATSTPDYAFPNQASLVQAKLKAVNAMCFDVSAACSGFITALDIAASMLKAGSYKYALVIGSEKMSEIVNWKDRSVCVLFGLVHGIGPDPIDQLVFPGKAAGNQRPEIPVHQHCLDSGRAELDTEHRLPTLNPLLCISHV